MGSVAKGWDRADDSLQRGMSDLFYEMEIFHILIFGGGYTDVYICQNHWILHMKRVNFTIHKLYLNRLGFRNKDKEKTLKIPKEKNYFQINKTVEYF